MNLTGRPIYEKPPKAKKDPAYLAKVRELPCVICTEYGLHQTTPTTAHHPIHGRHGTRKVPDEMAIPLCDGCHQGLWDTTKTAIHKEPKKWREQYGDDTDYIAVTQDAIERRKK